LSGGPCFHMEWFPFSWAAFQHSPPQMSLTRHVDGGRGLGPRSCSARVLPLGRGRDVETAAANNRFPPRRVNTSASLFRLSRPGVVGPELISYCDLCKPPVAPLRPRQPRCQRPAPRVAPARRPRGPSNAFGLATICHTRVCQLSSESLIRPPLASWSANACTSGRGRLPRMASRIRKGAGLIPKYVVGAGERHRGRRPRRRRPAHV